MLLITGFNRNVAQGHFGLGAQQAATGGTGITVRNGNFQVGSFPSVTNGTTQIMVWELKVLLLAVVLCIS